MNFMKQNLKFYEFLKNLYFKIKIWIICTNHDTYYFNFICNALHNEYAIYFYSAPYKHSSGENLIFSCSKCKNRIAWIICNKRSASIKEAKTKHMLNLGFMVFHLWIFIFQIYNFQINYIYK